MRIPRVHIGAELVVGEEVLLDKSQSHYLKHVLRLQPGAALLLFNGVEAIDYRATLSIEGKQLKAAIHSALALQTESGLDCEIIQGMGRSDHMDWVIQKTTELGAKRIAIFNATRTQSPMKSTQLEKKLVHWRGVAISACEQSGRAVIPALSFHADLDGAIAASSSESGLLLDFNGDALVSALRPLAQTISILLGPEGGLTQPEIQLAKTAGFKSIRLGPRVLRTETAATAALAIIQSSLGDLS